MYNTTNQFYSMHLSTIDDIGDIGDIPTQNMYPTIRYIQSISWQFPRCTDVVQSAGAGSKMWITPIHFRLTSRSKLHFRSANLPSIYLDPCDLATNDKSFYSIVHRIPRDTMLYWRWLRRRRHDDDMTTWTSSGVGQVLFGSEFGEIVDDDVGKLCRTTTLIVNDHSDSERRPLLVRTPPCHSDRMIVLFIFITKLVWQFLHIKIWICSTEDVVTGSGMNDWMEVVSYADANVASCGVSTL